MKQAKETIFGATLAAFSVPTTSPADTATLAELIAELGAKYPGIETELEGLSGSPAEQREQVRCGIAAIPFPFAPGELCPPPPSQVMQAVQRRLAADAAKTDALCCLDDSVLSAGSVSPPFDSRMPRKLQHLGDGLAEVGVRSVRLSDCCPWRKLLCVYVYAFCVSTGWSFVCCSMCVCGHSECKGGMHGVSFVCLFDVAQIRATAATLVSRIAEQEVQTIDTATVAAKFL